MEYTVVVRVAVDDLVEAVNQKLQDGWVPTGGVSTAMLPLSGVKQQVYMQAMTLSVQ